MKKNNLDDFLPDAKAAETILESVSDGVFTVDREWRVRFFNRAAEEITGIPREEAIGRRCSDVFRASMCEADCALRHTIEKGRPAINKPVYIIDADGRRIPISVSTAVLKNSEGSVFGGVETFRDLSVVEELRRELQKSFVFGDMVSRSASMRTLFQILPQVAASDSTVLIQGETGTGKELLARAIHTLGQRQGKAFVAVNCAALPDTLLESELFGYRAGAFTGAQKDKPGRFELARGGTLLLDEIGEISPVVQVKLLRVLQDKVVDPLGSTRPIKVDVRVIAATNRDLPELVKSGDFRQDLFYRINVVRLHLPPLRERKADVPLLVDHFVTRFNRIQGKTIQGVSRQVMAILMGHDFPGNIRELENIIEHAFVLCPDGLIEPEHLPEELRPSTSPSTRPEDLSSTVQAMERQTLMEALKRNRYNRAAAAKELGIHKSTFFKKVKSLGIELPDQDGRSTRHRPGS